MFRTAWAELAVKKVSAAAILFRLSAQSVVTKRRFHLLDLAHNAQIYFSYASEIDPSTRPEKNCSNAFLASCNMYLVERLSGTSYKLVSGIFVTCWFDFITSNLIVASAAAQTQRGCSFNKVTFRFFWPNYYTSYFLDLHSCREYKTI